MRHPSRMVTSGPPAGATRVLIADGDSAFTNALLRKLSADERFDVIGVAPTGEEAVELAVSLRPDLVLMNIDMPGVDGIETTRGIRERVESACVLLLSTVDDPKDVDAALGAGALGLVKRDCVTPDLLATTFGLALIIVALDARRSAHDRADAHFIR
jgi:two-component system response regulator DesR